jgi:hypothetical protein
MGGPAAPTVYTRAPYARRSCTRTLARWQITGLDVSLELHLGNVGSGAVLLWSQQPFLDAVIDLAAAHFKDPRRLGDFKTQLRK